MFEYGDRTGSDKKDASATGYASTTQAGSTTSTGAASTASTTSDTLGKPGSSTY
jgi:hypothetical protein